MDKREKNIYEVGEALLAVRLTQNIVAIETAFRENLQDCAETFLKALQIMLERTVAAQGNGKKGVVHYVCVSYLQSSFYTKLYQLRLDAYDKRHFDDLSDTHAYCSLDFIFQYISEDIDYFRKHIGKHVPHIKEHETMQFVARYGMHYFRIVQQFVADLIMPIVMQNISGTEPLTVTFGAYMDQTVCLTEACDEIFPC